MQASLRRACPLLQPIFRIDLAPGDGLELLAKIRELDSGVPMVVLTAHGSIDLAVKAIKEGAEQVLTKPVELKALLLVVRRLLEAARMRHVTAAGPYAPGPDRESDTRPS